MIEKIDTDIFVNTDKLVDVRSPSEFNNGHIPGAINLPLFDDDERSVIGKSYKKEGKQTAVIKGLEFVGHKQSQFLKKALEFSKGNKLGVYCWRGGMRSYSMSWLFSLGEMDTVVLKGGYKSYRKDVLSILKKPYNILVLGGKTGSGKTDILLELKDLGEQVVDLEGLANHKGSAFGGIGKGNQPSNQHFENLLAEELRKMDINRRIWLEDESERIGRVNINHDFFELKRSSPTIFIDIDFEKRVGNLVRDYGKFDKEKLIAGVGKIKKRLGGLQYKSAVESLEVENIDQAAQICLNYYDQAYEFSLKKKEHNKILRFTPDTANNREIAEELVRKAVTFEGEFKKLYRAIE